VTTPSPIYRRILDLAWPVLIGQWASFSYGVVDTVMTGHTSAVDLASMALGASIYVSVFVGLMGVLLAINPIVARHFGSGNNAAIGATWVQGVWLSVALSAIGIAALGFPDFWLSISAVEPAVQQHVGGYLQALAFALPAALLFRCMQSFNTALSRPKPIMIINVVGLCLKIPLNYILIHGAPGIPAMGVTGCGVATALLMWASCLAGYWLMRKDDFYRPFEIRFDWPRWHAQINLLRLGVPIGMAYAIEITSFTFMALIAARLGTHVTAAHQIAANLAAFCYMIPMSISMASSTLTAQALGADDHAAARKITRTGLGIALLCATLVASAMLLGRGPIVDFYTNDAQVAAIAFSLIPLLAVFHLSDALQAIAGFTLRAYQHALAPLVTYGVALWGGGLGGGYWIAFHPVIGGAPLGLHGLWLAAAASLGLTAFVLLAYLAWISRTAAQIAALRKQQLGTGA